eukprot:RCo031441
MLTFFPYRALLGRSKMGVLRAPALPARALPRQGVDAPICPVRAPCAAFHSCFSCSVVMPPRVIFRRAGAHLYSVSASPEITTAMLCSLRPGELRGVLVGLYPARLPADLTAHFGSSLDWAAALEKIRVETESTTWPDFEALSEASLTQEAGLSAEAARSFVQWVKSFDPSLRE